MKARLFFLIGIFACGSMHALVHVISLGRDCQVAGYLREAKLRQEAYPFDWLQTLDFDGFFRLLQDNFAQFLNPHWLTKQQHWRVHNTYYNIYFVHDFPNKTQNIHDEFFEGAPIVENFLDHVSDVQQRYARRIKRFRALLHSNDRVIFIRSHLLPLEGRALANFFETNYPNLNFTLVSLYDQFDGAIEPSDWNIARVKAFFMDEPAQWHVHKWWSPANWSTVFKELGLIKE